MVDDTQKKMVSFNNDVSIHMVPNQTQLGSKEKARLWLNNDDFATIKGECRDEIGHLDLAEEFDIFSFRGLELVSRDAQGAKEVNNILRAVVDEQDQRESTPKSVRKVYKSLSMPCVRAALENACIDEIAVKEYLSTTEEELRQETEQRQHKLQRRRRSSKTVEDLTFQNEQRQKPRRSITGSGLKMMRLKTVRRMLNRRTAPSPLDQ